MIKLNARTQESADIYVDAILEACKKAKLKDPVKAIVDTDFYPKLLKQPMIEYAIGWLHGVAECYGVTVVELWSHLAYHGEFSARRTRRKAA